MASFIDSTGTLIEYEDTSETGESGADGSSGSAQGHDGADSGGNGGGKGRSSLFSDCGVMDKTYVFSLCNKDNSVYYKVVIEPVKGDQPISNDLFHRDGLYAFVTGVNIQQNVREQTNYTLGNTVYLYVFGDAVTNLTISGFGFWECPDNGGSETFNTPEQLLDFYKDNKVSKHGKYCKVLLGEKTFLGYLISSDIGLTVESLGLVAFKFNFIGVFQDDE